MQFKTNEDIEAPIEFVFDAITDFEGFERLALRRGADFQRSDKLTEPGVGMAWAGQVDIRGKMRKFAIRITEFDRPNELGARATIGGLEMDISLELLAMSSLRTRMSATLDIRAKSISSRLMLQSARLAKNNLNRRYRARINEYARDLDDRYQRQTTS